MTKKLQRELTALCAAVTALVLAVLTCVCLSQTERSLLRQEQAQFQANIRTLHQNLQEAVLSHDWLQQMQQQYGLSLRILDNGAPLAFQALNEDPRQQALLDLAEAEAAKRYGADVRKLSVRAPLIEQSEFPLQNENGQRFFASFSLIPCFGGTRAVLALHALSPLFAQRFRSRLRFLLCDLAALLLLTVFFRRLIARLFLPLEENRKKQSRFVSAASHELRTPLSVLQSHIDAARTGALQPDAAFWETLDLQGQRMKRLLDDLLQLAAADQNRWSMHPVPTQLDTLVLRTYEAFEPQAAFRGLHWQVRLPDTPLPQCRCDPERIWQVLAILIDNAFSYTPSGGHITLSLCACHFSKGTLRGSTKGLSLSVSDDGPGIPDSQKQLVFSRFYRADPARTEKGHYGLGLGIASEIVRLHGGTLQLSDTQGGGATFTVTLRADEAAERTS